MAAAVSSVATDAESPRTGTLGVGGSTLCEHAANTVPVATAMVISASHRHREVREGTHRSIVVDLNLHGRSGEAVKDMRVGPVDLVLFLAIPRTGSDLRSLSGLLVVSLGDIDLIMPYGRSTDHGRSVADLRCYHGHSMHASGRWALAGLVQ
jgi:hypothetical protein